MQEFAVIARDEEGCWLEMEILAPNVFCLFEWFETDYPGWKILSYALKEDFEEGE